MNERLNPSETTIDHEQFERILRKVREVAPYDGQPIDGLGCYPTRYELPDVDVAIYIPTIGTEFAQDDDDPYDDTVRVIVRREEVIDDKHLIWYIKHYNLHLSENTAEYSESTIVRDALTGGPVDTVPSEDYEAIKKRYELKKVTTSNVFTKQRYDEAMAVLDSLEPDQRF